MICVRLDGAGVLSVVDVGTDGKCITTDFVLQSQVEVDSSPWVFDPEAFQLGVGGSLLMFVTGAGVGLVLNILRQSRRV